MYLLKWDDNAKLVGVMILPMLIPWIFVFNLIVCEPGEWVTNQFEHLGTAFGRCKWYDLSIRVQQMYLIALSDVQQSKNLQSYGGIQCTRETFKLVYSNERENDD